MHKEIKSHKKTLLILGIVLIAWTGVMIFSATMASLPAVNEYHYDENILTPNDYIEFEFGRWKVKDFWLDISPTVGYGGNGFTCFLVPDISSVTGPYARGYESYIYSSITYLSMDSATGSGSVLFTYNNVRYTTRINDEFRLVIVPAVNHVYNTQNLTISIYVTISFEDPLSSSMITDALLLALPAILFAIGVMIVHKTPRKPIPAPNPPVTLAAGQGNSFCASCGAELRVEQKFCDKCGTKQ